MKKYIFISLFFSLYSCNNENTALEKEINTEEELSLTSVKLTENQIKNAEITLSKIAKQEMASFIKVNGVIELPPQNTISISVPLGGYLKATKLVEGMQVKKGEVLASIEDQQYIQIQEDYLVAKAKILAIEKEYIRQKELNISKASSDKIYENAQSEYNSQKVLVKSLSEKLRLINVNPSTLTSENISRLINIYSPINGYVSVVNQNIGKYIAPTEVLFELVNPSNVFLSLTVFEKDIDNLFIGQNVVSYSNQNPDKRYQSSIKLISKSLNSNNTVHVICQFSASDASLYPGMYMNAEIIAPTKLAYVISNEGLVQFENKNYVFYKSNNTKFIMEEVKVLNQNENYTQIDFSPSFSNFEKEFVQKGAYNLLMKMKNTEED